MKTRIYIVMGAVFAGLIWGICSWILFYATSMHRDTFDALSVAEKRMVITKLVTYQDFNKVKQALRGVYPAEEPAIHGLGHLLGEVAYQKYHEGAFALCDQIFNYGCYHGVVDMAIRTKGLTPSLVFDLWKACSTTMKDPGPCIHPIGHASTILAKYDILAAFRTCDTIYPEEHTAFWCWQGAMMEYLTRNAPGAPEKIPLTLSGDLHYPCNTFPPKYEAACARMEVSFLAGKWEPDYNKLFQYCFSYQDHDTIFNCVDAMGGEIGQAFFTKPIDAILAACAWAGEHAKECVMGSVVTFATAGQKNKANALCRSVTTGAERMGCENRVEGMLP